MSWRDVAAKAEGRVESVDDALMDSMSGTGVKQNTGSGLGDQERRNNQVIEDMKTDDPIDFASMGDELMAGGGMVPSRNLRTPVENVVVSQLSPEDIRSLAQQNKFPKDFDRFPKNERFILVGDEYVRNPREVYGELKNEFERENFLNLMKATIDRKIKADEESFERFNSDFAAVVKGTAAAGAVALGGAVTGVGLAGTTAGARLIAGIKGLKPLVAHLGKYFTFRNVATDAAKAAAAIGIYEAVTRDPEMTDEELEQTIQTEVRKAVETEKDSGSPPMTEQSADSGR